MYSFRNDYSEGAHPTVMEALVQTNLEQTPGYGTDCRCAEAAATIRKLCGRPDAAVHFLVGGTQANLLVIHAFLRSFEAVIAASTGHINVHETGAVEATGHKVIDVPSSDGKVTPAMVEQVLSEHDGLEHMVRPKMVYISDSTEIGTIYTKNELAALHECCKENGLYLFLDGARLASAMTAEGNDLTLPDLAALTDVFYLGGTKNGALFGEAVVVLNEDAKPDFRSYMKQRGAMFAKGRLMGLQFSALLKDGLYFDLGRHANEQAARLRRGIANLGYPLSYGSPTNQIFPVFPNSVMEALAANYDFEVNRPVDRDHTCIRLVTSWSTPDSAVDGFLADLTAIG